MGRGGNPTPGVGEAPRLPGWLTQRTEHREEAELGSGGRMGSGAASRGLCRSGHRHQDFSLTTVENQLTTSNREMTLHGGGQPLKDDSCCLVEHRSRGSKETGQKTRAAVQKKNDGDWTGRSQQRRGEARHLVTRFGSSISRTAGRWAVGTERAKN